MFRVVMKIGTLVYRSAEIDSATAATQVATELTASGTATVVGIEHRPSWCGNCGWSMLTGEELTNEIENEEYLLTA